MSPAGEVMFTDFVTGNAFAIRPAIATLGVSEFSIPSEDASELYTFDARGRHLSTKNALTAAVLRSFFYNGDGKLLLIRDGTATKPRSSVPPRLNLLL